MSTSKQAREAWAALEQAVKKQCPSLSPDEIKVFAAYLVRELAKAVSDGKTPVFASEVAHEDQDLGGVVLRQTTLRLQLPGGQLGKLLDD